MPIYSKEPRPSELEILFKQAREGLIGPMQFYRELQQQDIGGARAMMYIRDAFDLPLEAAKGIVIETEYGSIENWVNVVEETLKNH